MTIAEQLRNQGRAEGRAEGRVAGRVAGRAEGRRIERAQLLVKLMRLKFGAGLSAEHVARIKATSYAQLERLVERVLTAESPEQFFAD